MIADLALLAVSALGLFLVVHGATTANPLGVGGTPWRDLWTFEGEIGVGPYLLFSVVLLALAYGVARITGRPWAALPLAWSGAALTVRLLRGIGRPR
ncbi:MAG: hypothetical protein M0D55_12195 [Elusimicrobiota bacterium]|nr:MAG: hypothetical protein M0D55_12195 [Elusimicrobiota bacterium]